MEKLFKLRDYINLEIARITDNTRVQLALEEKIMQAKTSLNEFSATSKNIQRDYITILGIFAAIILTFVSGLVFSNSVLQNIDKVSIYRLIAVISLIAIFIVNILNFLFSFIKQIHYGKDDKSSKFKSLNSFNIIMLLIIILTAVVWYFYRPYEHKTTTNSTTTININASDLANRRAK